MSFQLKVSKQLATTQLDKLKRKNGSFYEIFAKTDNNLRIFRAGYEGNFDPNNH